MKQTIVCFMKGNFQRWTWEDEDGVAWKCSECGATAKQAVHIDRVHGAARSNPYNLRQLVCGPECALTRKNRLQQERRALTQQAKKQTPRREAFVDVPAGKIGRATQNENALALVSAALREHVDPLGLISVPNVVRALEPRVSKAQVHAALLALYKQGALELRPEVGSEFLRPQDAALCPPGPRGTVLARARLL
jgi:hypothetical protein